MTSDHERLVESRLQRVDELTSLMLDESITDSQLDELEAALQQHSDARSRYLEEIRIHHDLIEYFAQENPRNKQSQSAPILSFLQEDPSGSGLELPRPPADLP